mmetsp:Transcript_18866/g.38838  ORF Transcript_18866/g.38838 Transcript_18866/m.38838 type:complete len:87 (+) Transcript_18866:149-409(+)
MIVLLNNDVLEPNEYTIDTPGDTIFNRNITTLLRQNATSFMPPHEIQSCPSWRISPPFQAVPVSHTQTGLPPQSHVQIHQLESKHL